MEKIFDNRPIQINEAYIGYDEKSLDKMNKDELLAELKNVEKDIKTINDEIEESNLEFPSFVLKEKLENAEWYKKKINDLLSVYKKEL